MIINSNTQRSKFRLARHTVVLSDMHLTEAEPSHPRRPLWKRYKRKKYFIDRSFRHFLQNISEQAGGSGIELVLNGDIFDFDAVLSLPEQKLFSINWLERARGLNAEEAKSCYKIRVILSDHRIWVEALRDFILAGNKVVFVIGNHDMELHWPSVQEEILRALHLPDDFLAQIRFCEWFYISNQDTLIEHGNQYDPYCLCLNPIHPLIKIGSKTFVRQPFGNLANRYMMNGMGLFNPHVESNYIMSAAQYVSFFFRYIVRTQPFLIGTWFWGAIATLLVSVGEGLLPAVKDPLTVENRVSFIAHKANASPRIARSLKEIHVHPAIFNPYQILRELWLDRALLFVAICFASFQIFSLVNLVSRATFLWFLIPLLFFLPFFMFYARSVKSDVMAFMDAVEQNAPLSAHIARVKRVVHGHTHREKHTYVGEVELLNSGSWSASFSDPECRHPVGKKAFVWIKPKSSSELMQLPNEPDEKSDDEHSSEMREPPTTLYTSRKAGLYFWDDEKGIVSESTTEGSFISDSKKANNA